MRIRRTLEVLREKLTSLGARHPIDPATIGAHEIIAMVPRDRVGVQLDVRADSLAMKLEQRFRPRRFGLGLGSPRENGAA